MTRMTQPTFAAGELSPACQARVDIAKFQAGAAELTNSYVHPQGGVSNRPGTEYVLRVPSEVHLIPFEFNTEQGYALAFGDRQEAPQYADLTILSPGPLETGTWGEQNNGFHIWLLDKPVDSVTNVYRVTEGEAPVALTEVPLSGLYGLEDAYSVAPTGDGRNRLYVHLRYDVGPGQRQFSVGPISRIQYEEPQAITYRGPGSLRVMKDGGAVLRDLTTATHKWTALAGHANVYYLTKTDNSAPDIGRPGTLEVFVNGAACSEVTSLPDIVSGAFAWIDPNTLGFRTLVLYYPMPIGGLVPGSISVVYVQSSPFTLPQAKGMSFCQSSDTVFLAHREVAPQALVRYDHNDWRFSTLTFEPTAPFPASVTATPTSGGGTGVVYTYRIYRYIHYWPVDDEIIIRGSTYEERTITAINPLAGAHIDISAAPNGQSPSGDSGIGRNGIAVYRSISGGAYTFVGVSYGPWTDTTSKTVADTGAAGTEPTWTSTAGTGTVRDASVAFPGTNTLRSYRYAVSAVTSAGESYPSPGTTVLMNDPWTAGAKVIVSWSPVAGAKMYEIYKNSRGQWGWIGTVDDALSFLDDNIDPDTTFAPIGVPVQLFQSAGNYPSCVGIYKQRLVYAGTNSAPSDIWMSRTGNLYDFSISDPARADDSLNLRPATGRADAIRHVVPFSGLLVFTAGAEWDLDIASTPPKFAPQSFMGTADGLPPILAGKVLLFARRGGKKISDFAFALESDGYDAKDLTITAEHVTADSRILGWAFAVNPDGIVWCVKEDGSIAALTYHREHQVSAWSRHSTAGVFRSVCVVVGEERDDTYFCVLRDNKHFIERLAERRTRGGCFLDSAVYYSGSPSATIPGLGHLAGLTVNALVLHQDSPQGSDTAWDGEVVRNLVVSAEGTVTLPFEATRAWVGLPYRSRMKTLRIMSQDASGPSLGRTQRVTSLSVRFLDSLGLSAGPDDPGLMPVDFQTGPGVFDAPTTVFSGEKKMPISGPWGEAAELVFQQDDPLPFTIVSITPSIELGQL